MLAGADFRPYLFRPDDGSFRAARGHRDELQSVKLNGHDPWSYLKDVLERLLTHPDNRIGELLPLAISW